MIEVYDILKKAAAAAEEKKGQDLVALDISKLTVLADAFLLVSGDNERQVAAITDAVEEALGKADVPLKGVEGRQNNEWVLLDYGDVIIHVFKRDSRAFYDLERIWRDAKRIDLKSL